MKKSKKILAIFSLVIILFLFSGCSKNNEEELKEKVIAELEYLNLKIIDMLNELNNISFNTYTVISEDVTLDKETQNKQGTEEGGQESTEGKTKQESEEGGQSGSNSQNSGQQGTENEELINTTKMVTDSTLAQDRNNIDWTKIKPEIELVNESWSVILLDLYGLNVKDEMILDFSSKLDSCIIAIKNEDKQQTLTLLAELYSDIPKFLKEINADENLQKIRQTQSYVINAYSLASDMGNSGIKDNLKSAIDIYLEVMSDIDYNKNKTYKTNKIYVLLNELYNSINERDSDLFYLKYRSFMKVVNEL